MLVINCSIASPVASILLFPDVMIVSRTLEILIVLYSSTLYMLVVVTARFVLDNVTKKTLTSSLQVGGKYL